MRIFISHSTKDGSFVSLLNERLEEARFETWVSEISIAPGTNWVEEINKGLAGADLVLLIWSPNAAASEATTREWSAALAREITERRIRLGVVMLKQCPLPLLLVTKQYIDAQADTETAIQATLKWLNTRRDVGRLAVPTPPVYLPFYEPQDFIGRDSEFEHLRDTLTRQPSRLLLYGEPGIGKSTLALKFAWEAQRDFDAVIFQVCGERSLDDISAELASHLPIDTRAKSPEEQREAAKKWLRERQSLLILDDVQSSEIYGLTPGPACSVLYTSRLQSLPWLSPSESLEVKRFSDADALNLFCLYLNNIFQESQVKAYSDLLLDFAKRVEYLPIAMTVAAVILRQKPGSRLDQAALGLRIDALRDGVRDVPDLFNKAIESLAEEEQQLLEACATCVPDGFWLPLAAGIANIPLKDVGEFRDKLIHASLLRVLDRNRQRFQIHSLLKAHLMTREPFLFSQMKHTAVIVGTFLHLGDAWGTCAEILNEVVPTMQWMAANTATTAAIWQLGGAAYHVAFSTGSFVSALQISKEVENICTRMGDERGLIGSYGDQAGVLQAWGKYDEAMELVKKQEALSLKSHFDPGLASAYGNQGVILRKQGKYREALELHRKEEALAKQLNNGEILATSYGNQAVILEMMDKQEEAFAYLHLMESHYAKAMDMVGLQRSYNNQASLLLRLVRSGYFGLAPFIVVSDSIGGGSPLRSSLPKEPLKEALNLLAMQEDICLEYNIRAELVYCYLHWAHALGVTGNDEGAREKLIAAAKIADEIGLQREAAMATVLLRNLSITDPDTWFELGEILYSESRS